MPFTEKVCLVLRCILQNVMIVYFVMTVDPDLQTKKIIAGTPGAILDVIKRKVWN